MASDEATTWGLAHSQAIYRAMVDPSVQQDGYDVLVHVQVAESLLSEIFKSPSSNAFDNLSEGYLETAFSSPESLAEALVNTALFRLINKGWPNVNTGHRAVSLSWDEILDDSDEQLPKDDDGKTIDHRVWTGQDWHIPPIIGFGADDFLSKSFDLIEQETSGEGSSAWPLALLCSSYAFFVTWRNMGESLHEGDAKYPRHSLDAYTAILDRCIEKDGTGSIGLANYLMQCLSAVVSFQNGNRSTGFSSLEESIFGAPKIEWALGYLDHELQQSSLKKGDLDLHEWLQMFRLTVISFENTNASDPGYGVLSPRSVRGLNCPITEEDYWAWRMGWVIASGVHLKDEIMDLAFRKELDQHPDELVDLVRKVPISIPLDLMQSFGPGSDWRTIDRDMTEIYYSISDNKSQTREFEVMDQVDYFFTNPIDDRKHWLIKLGFVWYMRSQLLLSSSGESSDEDGVLERLDRQWTDSEDERIKDLISSSTSETAEELKKLLANIQASLESFPAPVNQNPSTNQPITREQLAELLGDQLCDALSPDARWELTRAEGYFQNREDGDSGYVASQHYANCVERQLNEWLGPLHQDLIRLGVFAPENRPRKPRYIGEWSHYLRAEVLRLATAGLEFPKFWPWFDRTAVEVLVEALGDLSQARSQAHAGISPMMVNEARGLVLGELVGRAGPGILTIMAKLANRESSK